MTQLHINPPPISPQAMADLLCTIIILCRGIDNESKSFWTYLRIKPSMAQAFKEARIHGDFDLEDYGNILETGEGHDVPPEVMARMEQQYGINHHYEEELLKRVALLREQNAN